jgi:hypothetical protein
MTKWKIGCKVLNQGSSLVLGTFFKFSYQSGLGRYSVQHKFLACMKELIQCWYCLGSYQTSEVVATSVDNRVV